MVTPKYCAIRPYVDRKPPSEPAKPTKAFGNVRIPPPRGTTKRQSAPKPAKPAR